MTNRGSGAAILAFFVGVMPALLPGQEARPTGEGRQGTRAPAATSRPPGAARATAVDSPPAAEPAALAGKPSFDRVDTLMLMASAGLVMLMIPALGLFYGGMVRRKNVLASFQQSFILLSVVSIQWVLVGYSLSFGESALAGFVGGGPWWGLIGVGLEPNVALASRAAHQVFMVFQMMVAVFSGAVVERMKFSSYLVFILFWATLVYAPVAHWVWGPGGWLSTSGALDFAGGLVVHLTSGLAALCCVLVLGKRKGLDTEDLHPHNLTLTALGTGLLWYGWLGLNAGQARGANAAAAAAFVATNLAGAAAVLSWGVLEFLQKRKVTALGTCTGAIAGLVTVSPAAGYVTPLGALCLGLIGGPLCYAAISFKGKLGYDDSLDVFGVHGIGGLAGALALGFLAAPSLTGGAGGLLAGNADLLFAQAIAAGSVAIYTVVVTLAVLMLIDRVMGLRVSAEEEDIGLDLTQHGQRGYIMGEGELIGIEVR
jgi:ammonium transporter, Amt family